MINITEILLYKYRDDKSIKQISKDLGYSKNTIRHYLRGYDNFISMHPNKELCSTNYRALIEEYVLNISFNTPKPTYRVLTKEIIDEIDFYLQENISKKRLGLRKQIKRKEDIHQALVDKGFSISYSSVCKYIYTNYGSKYEECFIKQHHLLGYMAEFDWGEVTLFIKGEKRKFRMAVFALPGSTTRWAKLYQRETTISLQEAHIEFFKYIGGVPIEIVYDNMRTAVLFKNKGKKPTQGLLNLMSHYGFTHRFCNIRSGNEKGSVELSVKHMRSKAFSGNISELHFDSIEEANKHLEQCFETLNISDSNHELFIKEKQALLPLSCDYQCSTLSSAIVDKLSTICYDKSHYSVPDDYVGKTVELRIYSDQIRILYNKKEICRHDRSYKPSWNIKLDDYLKTLSIKSGALKNSEALRQSPLKLQEIYNLHFVDTPKEFIELLIFLRNNNLNYNHLYSVIDGLKSMNCDRLNIYIIREKIESTYINVDNTRTDQKQSIEAIEVEKYTQSNIHHLSRMLSNISCYGNA